MEERFSKEQQQNIHMQEKCYYEYADDEIDLKEVLLVLLNGKKIIAFTTIIVLVVTMLGSIIIPNLHIGTQGEVQNAVKLYFDGIDKGLDPTGEKYDPNEIKSPEVLKRAIDSTGIKKKVSISKLSENISLTAVLPNEVATTLKNISELKSEDIKMTKLEELEFYPDVYIVKLNVSNEIGISLEEGRQILDAILYEYRYWLIEKYSGYKIAPNLFSQDFNIKTYDYIQSVDIMSNELSMMRDYVETNIKEDNFVSPNTGFSKLDIINSINAIENVNIEMLYSDIAAKYVTKDSKRCVAIYEKLAEDKEILSAQKNEEAVAVMNLIQNFKRPSQITVLDDGLGEPFTLKDSSEAYDNLIDQYVIAAAKSTDAMQDAVYYRQQSERFKQPPFATGADSAIAKQIEKMILVTEKKIDQGANILNQTVRDFYSEKNYKKYSEQILPAQDYNQEKDVNLGLNMIIALVAGIILGMLIVLFKEYLGETHEKQTN